MGPKLKHSNVFLFWTVGVIFALSVLPCASKSFSQGSDGGGVGSVNLDKGWQYLWEGEHDVSASLDLPENEWKSFNYPQWFKAESGSDKVLWHRIKLPELSASDDTLFVRFPWQFFDLYLDGKQIYSNSNVSKDETGKFKGYLWHFVPLTEEASNKYLYFRIQSNDTYYGVYKGVHLGSKSAHMEWMFHEDKAKGFFFAVYMFLSAIALFIYIRLSEDRINLAFGLFVVSMGVYSLSTTYFRQFLSENTMFWTYMELTALHAAPISFVLFLNYLFGSGPFKMFRYIWIFGAAMTVVHIFSDVLFDYSMWTSLIQLQYYVLIIAATTLPRISYRAFKGDVEARVFFVGLFAVAFGAVYDIFISLGIFDDAQFVNHFTTLIFVFSLTNIMLHRYFDKLKRENIDLEEMVAERTDELTKTNSELTKENKQRVLAEKKWQEEHNKVLQNAKVASLGQIAAGVAHEINNPLQIISGSAGMLKRLPVLQLDEKASRQISRIDRMTRRIAGISSALLVFSQNDYNRSSTRVVVSNVLLGVIKQLNLIIEENGVELHVSGMRDEVSVVCYPEYIERVFKSVLENAIYAVSQQEERWVHVELLSESNVARIKISDSGQGINSEFRDKIFDPFFTTKEVGKGVGLGLSVAKGIIESEDGTIDVDYEAENTTFVMELPKAS